MKRPRCQYWYNSHPYCKNECQYVGKPSERFIVLDWICKGHLSYCEGYVSTKYIKPRGTNESDT